MEKLADVETCWLGALSMAVGEYISVSSQRDSEAADVQTERQQQALGPAARKRELVRMLQLRLLRRLAGVHCIQGLGLKLRAVSRACPLVQRLAKRMAQRLCCT